MSIDWVGRSKELKPCVRNFVNGRSRGAERGATLSKHSPRDGQLLCQFGGGDARDVDEAVANAREAFEDGRFEGRGEKFDRAALPREK